MKIVFPMLIAASAVAGHAVRANPFDCNGFPDFRARMSCYDVTSRGPATENDAVKPAVRSTEKRALSRTNKPRTKKPSG